MCATDSEASLFLVPKLCLGTHLLEALLPLVR
jgi:hypothetical protein